MPSRSASERTSAVHAARAARVGVVDRAELAEEERAALLSRPGGGALQVGAHAGPVGVRSPRGAQPPAGPLEPVRALVGEPERRVVVHRGDQAVVVGQAQRGQRIEDVPADRADDHGALGVGRADDRQRVGEQRVPALGGHRVVRLVEQLEAQPVVAVA